MARPLIVEDGPTCDLNTVVRHERITMTRITPIRDIAVTERAIVRSYD
ncbi:MAG: hypothetical protein IRY85_07985 [Micromonosporaceae bacterium]|nr:hypothetical protein [Micromonosporaceae bacterium]